MELISVILKPLLTEKSNKLREGKLKCYAFKVDPRANKFIVREAVEKLFSVKTVNCSIVNVSGKEKSMGMKGGKRATGKTSSWKKAYVTLAENQKIEKFEGA
jgi:large subunit ribosomal protein L23